MKKNLRATGEIIVLLLLLSGVAYLHLSPKNSDPPGVIRLECRGVNVTPLQKEACELLKNEFTRRDFEVKFLEREGRAVIPSLVQVQGSWSARVILGDDQFGPTPDCAFAVPYIVYGGTEDEALRAAAAAAAELMLSRYPCSPPCRI